MKKNWTLNLIIVIGIMMFLTLGKCFAEPEKVREKGGQVFFRGDWARLNIDREGDIFMSGENVDNKDGWGVGAGLHLPLFIDPFLHNNVMGEIMLSYYSFGSNDNDSPNQIFTAMIGPKYRILLGEPSTPIRRIKPFIGAGMLFGVISPPSNTVAYLDIGVQPFVGVDYTLPCLDDLLSIGMDYRYSFFAHDATRNDDFQTAGVYLGINF